ncbi:MAG: tetratricopeptide repeat protein [Synechococcales cyanobacterium CRU_2_2]|nr:tetratricopeptide repeat protein [Synechococcales cyanobacterium CRU_2_2]
MAFTKSNTEPNPEPNPKHPHKLSPRASAEQFLNRFEASLAPEDARDRSAGRAMGKDTAIAFHLYGPAGVGKSTLLRTLAQRLEKGNAGESSLGKGYANPGPGTRNVGVKGSFAFVSFGETERVETPIELMVTLFQTLVEQNNWIFKPKFLVMHERYEKTLQELAERPIEGKTTVSELQLKAHQTLVSYSLKPALDMAPEQSTAAAAAQAITQEQVLRVLQEHPSTQNDQPLQTLLLQPLRVLTAAFAEALQKRARRQPVVLILDTYEKASLAVDTWLWHLLLPQEVLQGSRVRWVLSSRQRLRDRPGWQQLLGEASPQLSSQPSSLLQEQELEPFDQAPAYFQNIGLPSHAEELLAATAGLPYGLRYMTHSPAMPPAEGDRGAIAPPAAVGSPLPAGIPANLTDLMQQHLSLTQRYIVGLAACCRSFNQDLIEYLLLAQDSNFAAAVEAESNGFDWLIQQDFVEQIQGCWRLDDVARNALRQSLLETDEALFLKIQGQLADYFLEGSNEAVRPDQSPAHQYRDPIWQRGRAEYLYHLLLSRHPDAQNQLRKHLLEGRYFRQDGIVQEPLTALMAEFPLAQHGLLEGSMRSFLQQLEPAIAHGSLIFDRSQIPYGLLEEALGLSKPDVDRTVQTCLKPVESLDGFAQFVALFYGSKHCAALQSGATGEPDPANEPLALLQRAQAIAERLTPVLASEPESAADLFLWKLGDRFSSLGEYEAAIAAYNKALEFQPNNAAAWDNRGSSLGCLGQFEASIRSFDKALELNPESHDAWHSRGLALAQSGRYEEAIASFDQALELKPDKHEPWYDKACCYALQGMSALALENLEQAIALNPDYRKMAKTDEDLAAIRDEEKFGQWVSG